MKKIIGLLLLVFTLQVMPVFAVERGTPEYERLKEFKKAQREARATQAANPEAYRTKQGPTFWEKEGERSGLNKVNLSGVGEGIKKLNPVPFFKEQNKKYKERQAQVAK